MSTTLELDPNGRRCTIRLAGAVTLPDIERCIDHQIACGAWTLDTVIDTTESTDIQLGFDGVQQLISYLKHRGAELPHRGRMVVVAPKAAAYGTSRMFQIAAESQIDAAFEVVRSMREADEWLSSVESS
jgi:hypothetical protein